MSEKCVCVDVRQRKSDEWDEWEMHRVEWWKRSGVE